MLTPNVMPKLYVGRIGRETSDKITRSFAECEENDLTLRQVLCPHCKSIVAEVFSDAVGHQRFKCQKCKAVTVINLAYFRRFKRHCGNERSYFGRLKVKDKDTID